MTFTSTVELLTYIRSKMILDRVSIKDLSERMHKSQPAVSALLKQENISLEMLKDVCDALNYKIEIDIQNKNDAG